MVEFISSGLVFIYYVVSVFMIFYLYSSYKICPELLWLVFQMLMFFGVSSIVDFSYKSDIELLFLYFIGLLSFTAGVFFFNLINRPLKKIKFDSNLKNYSARKFYLFLMIFVSILLCSFFFIRGGGNVFINGIYAIITDSEYSVKYARMGFLSVPGVGYIYQLRVIVLPLCVLYYVFFNKKKLSSYILSIIMILFLIGTGQRGGLVSFILITLITIYYKSNSTNEFGSILNKSKFRKDLYLKIISVAVILFGLSTIMNKRVSETGNVFTAMLQRIFKDNQGSAVTGFRYIFNEPIQYGRDWILQLLDVLPGRNTYISLDTKIFSYIYGGSMAGTAPPCIWGSAYYNFDIFGVIILGFFLAWITSKLHSSFSRKKCDELEIIVYSALQFLIAFWVAGGPVVLFNNGFITVVIFYFIMQIALKYRVSFAHKRS